MNAGTSPGIAVPTPNKKYIYNLASLGSSIFSLFNTLNQLLELPNCNCRLGSAIS